MSKLIELKQQVLQQVYKEINNVVVLCKVTHNEFKTLQPKDIIINLVIDAIELEDKAVKNYQYNIKFKLLIDLSLIKITNYELLKCEILEKILGFLNRIEYNFYCSIVNHNIKAENNSQNDNYNSKHDLIKVSWRSNLDLSEEVYN